MVTTFPPCQSRQQPAPPPLDPAAAPSSVGCEDGHTVGEWPIPPGATRRTRPPASRKAPLEPMLTIAQTAELLQVSEKTVRRRIAERSLVAHRVGGQWRIAPSDVADYLRDARRVH